jgi:hypothetical protein
MPSATSLSCGVMPFFWSTVFSSFIAPVWSVTMCCANWRTRAFLLFFRAVLACSISPLFADSTTAAICASVSVVSGAEAVV